MERDPVAAGIPPERRLPDGALVSGLWCRGRDAGGLRALCVALDATLAPDAETPAYCLPEVGWYGSWAALGAAWQRGGPTTGPAGHLDCRWAEGLHCGEPAASRAASWLPRERPMMWDALVHTTIVSRLVRARRGRRDAVVGDWLRAQGAHNALPFAPRSKQRRIRSRPRSHGPPPEHSVDTGDVPADGHDAEH